MRNYTEFNFGKSFTGKTARMLHELRDEKRVVLTDPKCAQLVDLKGWDHLWPIYDEVQNRWEPGFADYFRKRLNKRFRAMIHFRANFREQLNLLCTLMMSVQHVTVAIDEMGLFVPAGPPSALSPAITAAIISGRHEWLKFTGTAQNPSLVHMTIKASAERLRWYRLTEENALKDARPYVGKFVSELPNLPDYVCIETSDGGIPFRDESLVGKIKILPRVKNG